MLRVTQNKDEIIIRQIQIVRWISFLLTAGFFSIPVIGALSLNKDFSQAQWVWLLVFLVMFCFFLFLALAVPVITTKINQPGQTISVRKQSLIKYAFNIYSFNEIVDLIYVNETGGAGGKMKYQLLLPLKDGRKIELSTLVFVDEGQYFNAADLINKYVFDSTTQTPFKLTVFNDD